LSAEEAVGYGIVDDIVSPRAAKAARLAAVAGLGGRGGLGRAGGRGRPEVH
jgi:hypothetical protein